MRPRSRNSQPPPAAVRSLFTRIAGIYDRLNRVLTLGVDVLWRRRALERLETAPERILDLATGTADLALAAARRFPAADVTGVDLTPAMLEIARAKVARAGLSGRIALREGNALALDFPANRFDAVLCAFGFRNFPDQERALKEAARVLAPGGVLVVLELFRSPSRVLGGATSLWLRFLAPVFARKAKADYAYLRTSIARTRTAAEFQALAAACGFVCDRSDFFPPACSCLVFHLGHGQSGPKEVQWRRGGLSCGGTVCISGDMMKETT
ncbi:MAG: ubiquinone/menaquinone biosynthesis methyltransferase [Kiritimatiellia bacterium]